jgi:hypothetical protein
MSAPEANLELETQVFKWDYESGAYETQNFRPDYANGFDSEKLASFFEEMQWIKDWNIKTQIFGSRWIPIMVLLIIG